MEALLDVSGSDIKTDRHSLYLQNEEKRVGSGDERSLHREMCPSGMLLTY